MVCYARHLYNTLVAFAESLFLDAMPLEVFDYVYKVTHSLPQIVVGVYNGSQPSNAVRRGMGFHGRLCSSTSPACPRKSSSTTICR